MTCLPIVTFHSIDPSGSVVSMRADEFSRIAGRLAREGWRGVTLSEGLEARRAGDRARLVVLTFDDGYANLRREALPVLDRLGFRATVFVIAGRVGRDNRWPGQLPAIPTMPLADRDDLGALAAAGWELGAHGIDHLPLTRADPAQVAREIDGAHELLERACGRPITTFAYPYGVTDARARALARARYRAACGARLAVATDADLAAPFDLPRIDAHYLRHFPPVALDGTIGRGYLALRRWIRRLRADPWDSTALDGTPAS